MAGRYSTHHAHSLTHAPFHDAPCIRHDQVAHGAGSIVGHRAQPFDDGAHGMACWPQDVCAAVRPGGGAARARHRALRPQARQRAGQGARCAPLWPAEPGTLGTLHLPTWPVSLRRSRPDRIHRHHHEPVWVCLTSCPTGMAWHACLLNARATRAHPVVDGRMADVWLAAWLAGWVHAGRDAGAGGLRREHDVRVQRAAVAGEQVRCAAGRQAEPTGRGSCASLSTSIRTLAQGQGCRRSSCL